MIDEILDNKKVDYNKEYADYLRCKNCGRKTSGIDDYKNIKSGKLTKTCLMCRVSVYSSLKKHPHTIKKVFKLRDKVDSLLNLIRHIDPEILKDAVEKSGDDRLQNFIVY